MIYLIKKGSLGEIHKHLTHMLHLANATMSAPITARAAQTL